MASDDYDFRDREAETPHGQISRREFVTRSAATVAGATLGASLLSSGVDAASAEKWKPPNFNGTTVNALMVSGEDDAEPLRDAVPAIKKLFGINLVVTDLEIGAMHDKALASLRAGIGTYDVIDVLGFWVAEFVGAGYFTPLEPFVKGRKLTPPNWDFHDFPRQQLDYVGYFNTKQQSFGTPGTLYLIPGAHSGPAMMYYRTDILAAHGLPVPKTWSEYLHTVKTVHNPSKGIYGNVFVGANDPSLFLVDWYSRFLTLGGKLMSGSPQQHTFRSHLDSPIGIKALQTILDVKPYAPPGVDSYGFTESVDAMETGKVALQLMWATIAGPLFDPTQSKVVGKVAAGLIPGDRKHRGESVRGGWGLGIPKNSNNKEAAWEVIQYFASKPAEVYRTLKYDIDPNRVSTHQNPRIVKKFPFMPVLLKQYYKAHILEIATIPETFELIGAANQEFNLAIAGHQSAPEAAKKANNRWLEILRRGGHLTGAS